MPPLPAPAPASTPSASRAGPSRRAKRIKASRHVSAAAAAAPPNADDAPRDTVVLDGANLAWTFSASLFAKHGCRTRLPLSRGLTLALESEVWADLGVTPVAFMPESYVQGPLHGLADGGSLETLVPGNVAYQGGSTWRNVVLWRLVERGALVAVPRPAGARDADDARILAFARERDALICSNDRYEDHCARASVPKDLRRWLRRNRSGYEFSVGTPEDAAYEAGKPAVEPPPVGCAHLPPPPEGEAGENRVARGDARGGELAPLGAGGGPVGPGQEGCARGAGQAEKAPHLDEPGGRRETRRGRAARTRVPVLRASAFGPAGDVPLEEEVSARNGVRTYFLVD